jgi:hypothetical protein
MVMVGLEREVAVVAIGRAWTHGRAWTPGRPLTRQGRWRCRDGKGGSAGTAREAASEEDAGVVAKAVRWLNSTERKSNTDDNLKRT